MLELVSISQSWDYYTPIAGGDFILDFLEPLEEELE